MGIGLGLIFVPSMSVISHYFARRRALAIGLAFAGSSIGGVMQPIMVNRLLNGPLGFANGVRANTGLIAGMLLVGNLLMRPRPLNEIHFAPKARIDVKAYLRDGPYMALLLACVQYLALRVDVERRNAVLASSHWECSSPVRLAWMRSSHGDLIELLPAQWCTYNWTPFSTALTQNSPSIR